MRASNKRVTLGLDCDASSADAFVDSMVTREILPCEKKHGPLTTRKVQPENERRTSRERPEHSKLRNRRQCRRGRSTRAASTRAHPAAATRRSEALSQSARSTPSKNSSSSSTAGCPDRGTAASSEHRGRQVIKLTTDSGSVWMQASRRSGRRVQCTDSATTSYEMAPFLMPLDRDTERSQRTRVLAVIARR